MMTMPIDLPMTSDGTSHFSINLIIHPFQCQIQGELQICGILNTMMAMFGETPTDISANFVIQNVIIPPHFAWEMTAAL